MIAAVILAAGQSRRMGRPKLLLPWGAATVIGQVVGVLLQAGLTEIVAVTGGARPAVEAALAALPVRAVYNPGHAQGEMLSSFQVGLQALGPQVSAALLVLGDQPQIELSTVQAVLAAHHQTGAALIVPSYQRRRGHPWLVARSLWAEVLALRDPTTLRDFLNADPARLHYLPVATPSILQDLDTPEDYARARP
jgi:molybdenum cofactor cytidylyltransferase